MGNEMIQLILDKLAVIEKLLSGNGDPSKGIVVRLDRVEGKQRRADWVMGAIMGVVCTATAGVVVDLVSKHLR